MKAHTKTDPESSRRALPPGFTLVEMVITILLAGILAGLFTNFFVLGVDIFELTDKNQAVNQNSRIVLNHLSREIRQALTVTITSATDLSLTADIDGDGDVENVRYYISGSGLRKSIDVTSDIVVLENTAVSFSGDSNRVIISVTITYNGIILNLETSVLRRRALSQGQPPKHKRTVLAA